MDETSILRYSRQIILPQVGFAGQERLLGASVMIVGLGGLGSPVAIHLARAGVGHLVLADGDRVTLDNLHRQTLYGETDLGRPKTQVAGECLKKIRQNLALTLHEARMDEPSLLRAVAQVDLVVDASDNFPTRQAVNRACVVQGIPLVWGAASHWEGQVSVVLPQSGSPCYRCLVDCREAPPKGCDTLGVWPVVTALVGGIQAHEALKLLLGLGDSLAGKVLLIETQSMHMHQVAIHKKPDCPVCAHPVTKKRITGP
ncbi:MAG: molybdopterin biosynthesis protein MoeB [Magnetococcales bacterium]|nr:molybdopterin biosynthesis protein MoeB [Magnetococcales bacterium]